MTNVTTFPGAKATDTLIPSAVKVTIGTGEDAREITLATFCLAKTIQTFAYMTELAQEAGLSDAVAAADNSKAAGEFNGQDVAPSFVRKALAILPVALKQGQPALFRLLGVLITPNSVLRKMVENEEDLNGYLLTQGRDVAFTATNDQIIQLVMAAVQVMGVQSIIQNLPNLMGLLSSVKS